MSDHMEQAAQNQLEASMAYYEELSDEVIPFAQQHIDRLSSGYHSDWSKADRDNRDALEAGHPPMHEYPNLQSYMREAILQTVKDMRLSQPKGAPDES